MLSKSYVTLQPAWDKCALPTSTSASATVSTQVRRLLSEWSEGNRQQRMLLSEDSDRDGNALPRPMDEGGEQLQWTHIERRRHACCAVRVVGSCMVRLASCNMYMPAANCNQLVHEVLGGDASCPQSKPAAGSQHLTGPLLTKHHKKPHACRHS